MASIIKIKRKNGFAYAIQYYHNKKRKYKYFPAGIDKSIVIAKKKEIEANLALEKSGIKPFSTDTKPIPSMTIQEFILWYQQKRLNENNIATTTIERYIIALRIFARFIGTNTLLSEITSDHIENFKTNQLKLGKNKIGINKNLHHLHHPFKIAYEFGFIHTPLKIIKFKVQKSLPEFLTPDELITIEKHLSGQSALAFTIMKWTGIRRSELCLRSLKKHYDFKNNFLLIIGKNNEHRRVPIHPELSNYLNSNKIFNSRKPDQHIITIKPETLTKNIRLAIKKANINKKGSAHLLRHSLGCYLINNGFDIREVQAMLGHKTLQMTILYTKVLNNKLQSKFNKINYK